MSPAGATARMPSPVRGWLLAGAVYFLAGFHRASLGVAGLLAETRFGIDAGQLSVFVLLQIGVYAAMQIPTGVLVDRYGPRRLLITAASLMGVAQLLFAVAPSYPVALLARAALGCGDAMTFISVLRYSARHFTPRQYPVIVALTGVLGILGNVLATVPLQLLLQHVGWVPSFAATGTITVVTGGVLFAMLHDDTAPAPIAGAAELRRGVRAVRVRVRAAWSLPGTRLGFWIHFSCMATATSLGVLWGHPYLVDGVGLSSTAAGAVLMTGVIASGVCGPFVGVVIGRRPVWRVPIALGAASASVLGWTAVVALLGDHPSPVVVSVVFVVSMVGGPVSMISFAVARDYNQARTIGTASGTVNVGGFLAAVIICLVFGWTLTLLGGTSPHTMRLAMLVMVVVQGAGVLRVAAWYRRVRAQVLARQAAGEDVPVAVATRRWWDLPDGDAGEPWVEGALAG